MRALSRAVLIGFIVFAFLAAAQVFAIWPPSTAFEEDLDKPSRQDIPVLDRLEEDTRRLEIVLRDLKEEHQELKRSAEAHSKTDETKEKVEVR